MDAENPYDAPHDSREVSTPIRSAARKVGTAILVLGLVILAYGAIAFWLINSLPPNGGAHGRLPSLYVMGAGMLVAFVGLIGRDFRIHRGRDIATVAGDE